MSVVDNAKQQFADVSAQAQNVHKTKFELLCVVLSSVLTTANTFVVCRTAPLHLDDHLRLICFLSTSVYSALGVSAIMRYINRRFTYLLTYW